MANLYKNTSLIAKDALRLIKNKKMVSEAFNTDFEKEFHGEMAVGSQIQVKLPQRFISTRGMGYQPQGINRITTTVNLDQWLQIAFEWDDMERAINLERSDAEIRKQYLDPLADQAAQDIDSDAAQFAYLNSPNVVGTLGTDGTTWNNAFAAERKLLELGCPPGDRWLCINPSLMQSMVQNNLTQFNPSDEISKMFKRGYVGAAAGWEWYRSVALYKHTAGTAPTSGATVTGAGQTGNSLIITGTVGQTIKKGDKFSIANVLQVNPVTRRAIGSNKHFTFTQDFTLTGGADTLPILPAIYGPGSQYQNVDALAADAAALTFWPGTTTPSGLSGTISLGLSKYAFCMVGAKLYSPKAVELCSQAHDEVSGLANRFVKAWDPVRSMTVHRFDMLYGFGLYYPENGSVCVAGA